MEQLEYLYDDGVNIVIVHNESGYNVNIECENPPMMTFQSFEDMLYGIAPIAQKYMLDVLDVEALAIALNYNFRNDLGEKGITELLLK